MHVYQWWHNETRIIQMIRNIRVAKKCIAIQAHEKGFSYIFDSFSRFTCMLLTTQPLPYQCICNIHFLKDTLATWGKKEHDFLSIRTTKSDGTLLQVPSAEVPPCPQLQVQVHRHIRFKTCSPSRQEHAIRTYRGEISKEFIEAIYMTHSIIIHPISHI